MSSVCGFIDQSDELCLTASLSSQHANGALPPCGRIALSERVSNSSTPLGIGSSLRLSPDSSQRPRRSQTDQIRHSSHVSHAKSDLPTKIVLVCDQEEFSERRLSQTMLPVHNEPGIILIAVNNDGTVGIVNNDVRSEARTVLSHDHRERMFSSHCQ